MSVLGIVDTNRWPFGEGPPLHPSHPPMGEEPELDAAYAQLVKLHKAYRAGPGGTATMKMLRAARRSYVKLIEEYIAEHEQADGSSMPLTNETG